jgi:uridine kinase
MLIIFIAGGSASGKTELALQLREQFNALEINCLSIKLDDYYKEMPDGADLVQYKQTTNFDDPSCIDFLLLKTHVLMLQRGECIEKPVFDFKTERRVNVEPMSPPAVLLIEGTSSLLFAHQIQEDLHHSYKIFIEVTPDTLLARRVTRDKLERGYADEESILTKDTDHVRPTFLSLIEPSKHFADIRIDNNKTHTLPTEKHPLTISAEEIVAGLVTDQ